MQRIYIEKWKTVLATVYTPPGCSKENLLKVTRAIEYEAENLGAPDPTVVIIGDFNLPNIKWHKTTISGETNADKTKLTHYLQ